MGFILVWFRDNACIMFISASSTNEDNVAKMITLNDFYNNGICELPLPGRYTVSIKIHGMWQVILEKTISITGQGHNHPPVFFIRHFNLPFMDFEISTDVVCEEVVFTYQNGLLIDRLKKRKNKKEWIGKALWNGEFLGFFILRRK